MGSEIQVTPIWHKEYWSPRGEKSAFLLLEFKGICDETDKGNRTVVARNSLLTITTAENVRIVHTYGYKTLTTKQGLILPLGDVRNHEMKWILVELSFNPHKPGKHKVIQLQWEYVETNEGCERQMLDFVKANFTNDYFLVDHFINFYVDKKIKISESAKTIEQAILELENGDEQAGKWLLRRQADSLLVAGIQRKDSELWQEAVKLYEKLEKFQYSKERA